MRKLEQERQEMKKNQESMMNNAMHEKFKSELGDRYNKEEVDRLVKQKEKESKMKVRKDIEDYDDENDNGESMDDDSDQQNDFAKAGRYVGQTEKLLK